MIDFASLDTRGYRTVDVRCGYGQWVSTYDETVEDAMDIELLSALRDVPWRTIEHAVDLGCGTGIYDRLVEADVASTGLESARYDLVTTCLVDEHLRDIGPLYGEACRLSRSGAVYVLVGYHPHFLMASGIPTHYDDAAGEPVAIETHVHLLRRARHGWAGGRLEAHRDARTCRRRRMARVEAAMGALARSAGQLRPRVAGDRPCCFTVAGRQ
jgi:SAM-dependent methyltransferase